MARAGLWAAGLLIVAAAVGIALYPRVTRAPYVTPVVEAPADGNTAAFPGLLDLIATAPGGTVRVLWTHGMCSHPPSWIDDRVNRLAALVGGSRQSLGGRAIGTHGATLRKERIVAGARSVEIAFLSWSAITEPLKASLTFDESTAFGGDFPYERATLNRELKRGLVNNCLVDVVAYAGPNGDAIRRAMIDAVCDAVGGRGSDGNCDMAEAQPPGSLALVTESLGGKMLFDAIQLVDAIVQASRDQAAIERLSRGLAAAKMIYLLSNQVPLLDSADPPGGATRETPVFLSRVGISVARAFALLARARDRSPPAGGAPEGPLTAVAFSDPNDLLSYRLVPAYLGDHPRHFRIVNVIVSNAATYLDYVERPDLGHCVYAWNPQVLAMLAEGHKPGRPPRQLPASLSSSCHGEIGLGRR